MKCGGLKKSNERVTSLRQMHLFLSITKKSIKRYDSKKAAFRTWLYKIASNRLVDYYRSKSYRYAQIEEPLENIDIEYTYDLTISLEYKEDYEKVTSIVNELEASSQQIMRLKLFGEYTFQEIAAIEDMPLSTVKTKYYTSLKHIRASMKEESHE